MTIKQTKQIKAEVAVNANLVKDTVPVVFTGKRITAEGRETVVAPFTVEVPKSALQV